MSYDVLPHSLLGFGRCVTSCDTNDPNLISPLPSLFFLLLHLPSPPLILQGIEPFSITQAYKFRLIERPVANDTADGQHASAGHAAVSSHGTFGGSTITAVYDYIVALMTQLCIQHGEQNVFTGDDAHQVALHSATVGEAVTAVTNLTSAVQALYDVVEQGAGMNTTDAHAGPLSPDSTAYSHFVRFEEIYQGRMFHNNDTAASGPVRSVEPPLP